MLMERVATTTDDYLPLSHRITYLTRALSSAETNATSRAVSLRFPI